MTVTPIKQYITIFLLPRITFSAMLYQNMVLNKMRKSKKQIPEGVDSCTKLLDLEVTDKRKRRNSSPFLLPLRHAGNDVPSESNKGSTVNIEQCDSTQKWQCRKIWKMIQSFLISIWRSLFYSESILYSFLFMRTCYLS